MSLSAAAGAATTTSTTNTTSTVQTQQQQHHSLPLGWTTVQRKQPQSLLNKRQRLQEDSTTNTRETTNSSSIVDVDNNNNDDDDQFLSLSSSSAAAVAAAYCKCCPDGTSSMSSFINSLFNDQSLVYSQNNNLINPKIIHTKAIFCLHDIDPQWFQGYILFPKNKDNTYNNNATIQNNNDNNDNNNSWGVLCIQEEIDECLQCYDGGGYHQLTMSINTYYSKKNSNNNRSSSNQTKDTFKNNNIHTNNRPSIVKTKQPKRIQKVSNIQWTGADMIKLSYHNNSNNSISKNGTTTSSTSTGNVTNNENYIDDNDNEWIIQTLNFDTDQLITDTATIPYVEKYFSSLVQKIIRMQQQHNDKEVLQSNNLHFHHDIPNNNTIEISNLLPNVAIVIGTISVVFY